MNKKLSTTAVRVITASIALPIYILMMLCGSWIYATGITLSIAMCIWEELRALQHAGYKPVRWIPFAAVAANYAAIMLRIFGVWKGSLTGLLLPFYMTMLFVLILIVLRRQQPELTDITMTLVPTFSIGLPHFCMVGFVGRLGEPVAQLIACLVFGIAILCDTTAYFVGRGIGGPKLCPAVSPKKTVSGGIGGIIGSVVCSVLLPLIFRAVYPHLALPPIWAFALCGLMGGVASQTGDLFASVVKRHCDIKDYGDLFPGHGGMMDRADSILFSAVIVYSFYLILQ